MLFACPGPLFVKLKLHMRAFEVPLWLVSAAFTVVGNGVNTALIVCGAFIVMVVVALLALATLPVQFVKAYPAAGVAVKLATLAALKKLPETGVIFPPPTGVTDEVSAYCVLKAAV